MSPEQADPMPKTEPKTTMPTPDPAAPPADAYHPEAVEAKWQARWEERHTNEPDLDGPSGRSTTS